MNDEKDWRVTERQIISINRNTIGSSVTKNDFLATEEPLEIRLGWTENGRNVHKSISITMRTPDDDFSLAVGFLFTEGILQNPDQIKQIKHCGIKTADAPRNTVRIDITNKESIDFKKLERHFYTTSSCGVCGKSSIEALYSEAKKLSIETVDKISPVIICRLPELIRRKQQVFKQTGGLHAAALFDFQGNLMDLREDVGRHNALDKLIGYQFLNNNLPLSESVLQVSGRASFELVQKALTAGIPVMSAVGAPSSLAVKLADEFNMTLCGFVRENSFNIYTHADRLLLENY